MAVCTPDGSLNIAFSLYADTDPTNEKFAPRAGDTVRAQNEDDSIEPGWVVQRTYLDASEGVPMVALAKGERTLKIPTAHLGSLNRKATDDDLARAKNPHELFDSIRRLGVIQTSKGTSPAAEAIGTINRVLAGTLADRSVTSQHQLRTTVTQLKNNFGSSRK